MALNVKHTEYRGAEAAARYVELLTGNADAVMCFRLIHDVDKTRTALNHTSTLARALAPFIERQRDDFGVFAVVNEGGSKAEAIKRVRAVFIDGDDIPIPDAWHVPPCFIVQRDATHWHAYWPVDEAFPLDAFTSTQKRLAVRYGSDDAVTDLPRVMRVPGFLHLKDPVETCKVVLLDYSGGKAGHTVRRYSLAEVVQGLPELLEKPAPAVDEVGDGAPVTASIVRDMLARISPDLPRKEWGAVAAGLRDANIITSDTKEPDESFDRREAFLDWSRPAQNFASEQDTYRMYDDMEPGKRGGASFGSLVHLARKSGYDGPVAVTTQPAPPPDSESLMARFGSFFGETVEDAHAKPSRFKVSNYARLLTFPPPEWLVSGLIERRSINLWYGEEGLGKSFIALGACLDWAEGLAWAAIKHADGKSYGGFDPGRPLNIAYIVGEGVAGMATQRRIAHLKHHGRDPEKLLPFGIIENMPNFTQQSEVDELIAALAEYERAEGSLDLLVIDTMARAMAGADENAVKDAGLFIRACDQIIARFGCALIVIHHTGKDKSKGARGSSANSANMGGRLYIDGDKDKQTLKITDQKQKDGGKIKRPMFFRGHELQFDYRGKQVTSLAFERVASDPAYAGLDPNAVVRREAIDALMRLGHNKPKTTDELADEMLHDRPDTAELLKAEDREGLTWKRLVLAEAKRLRELARPSREATAKEKARPPGPLLDLTVPSSRGKGNSLLWIAPAADRERAATLEAIGDTLDPD
jgi:hypothetical protein